MKKTLLFMIGMLSFSILTVSFQSCLGKDNDGTGAGEDTVNETDILKTEEKLKGLDIGLWVTPPVHLTQTTEDIEREYRRIKDAGMNMVWGFWDYGKNSATCWIYAPRLGSVI